MKEKKCLVCLSGGIDSVTSLAYMESLGCEIETVGFTYGSKHNQYENKAAQDLADHYGVPYQLIDLTPSMAGFRSSLMKTGGDIPEGHYSDETMKSTVVPGRNIIFLSILAGLAASRNAEIVTIGIHAGDHAIYPDCRPEFFVSMNRAVILGTDRQVRLEAPFLMKDKKAIVEWGLRYRVPYQLTRTCYKDQPIACGKCGSCRERLEAFHENNEVDPIEYEDEVDA